MSGRGSRPRWLRQHDKRTRLDRRLDRLHDGVDRVSLDLMRLMQAFDVQTVTEAQMERAEAQATAEVAAAVDDIFAEGGQP